MTTGLTYTTYQTQVSEMAVVSQTDPNFVAILPAMIDYAELRIYRDLDLLAASPAAAAGVRLESLMTSLEAYLRIAAPKEDGTTAPDALAGRASDSESAPDEPPKEATP